MYNNHSSANLVLSLTVKILENLPSFHAVMDKTIVAPFSDSRGMQRNDSRFTFL